MGKEEPLRRQKISSLTARSVGYGKWTSRSLMDAYACAGVTEAGGCRGFQGGTLTLARP